MPARSQSLLQRITDSKAVIVWSSLDSYRILLPIKSNKTPPRPPNRNHDSINIGNFFLKRKLNNGKSIC